MRLPMLTKQMLVNSLKGRCLSGIKIMAKIKQFSSNYSVDFMKYSVLTKPDLTAPPIADPTPTTKDVPPLTAAAWTSLSLADFKTNFSKLSPKDAATLYQNLKPLNEINWKYLTQQQKQMRSLFCLLTFY